MNLNCEIVQSIEFNAIMTYDDWTIFEYQDKYYVADKEGIYQVVLVSKCKPEDYTDDDVINFGDSYCGESDDGKWYLGFNKIRKDDEV